MRAHRVKLANPVVLEEKTNGQDRVIVRMLINDGSSSSITQKTGLQKCQNARNVATTQRTVDKDAFHINFRPVACNLL